MTTSQFREGKGGSVFTSTQPRQKHVVKDHMYLWYARTPNLDYLERLKRKSGVLPRPMAAPGWWYAPTNPLLTRTTLETIA